MKLKLYFLSLCSLMSLCSVNCTYAGSDTNSELVDSLEKFIQKNVPLKEPQFRCTYNMEKGLFACELRIGDKLYTPHKRYKKKREAKIASAKYALNDLLVARLNELLANNPNTKGTQMEPSYNIGCELHIGEQVYKLDKSYPTKNEAYRAIVKYTLNQLQTKTEARQDKLQVNDSIQSIDSSNNDTSESNPVDLLNDFIHASNPNSQQPKLEYKYDKTNEGMFTCKLFIDNEVYTQDKSFKSEEAAKLAIAEYALNKLLHKDNVARLNKLLANDPNLNKTQVKRSYNISCELHIGEQVYKQDKSYPTKGKAYRAIVKYTINQLQTQTDSVQLLEDFIHNSNPNSQQPELKYEHDTTNDGMFTCKLSIDNEVYTQDKSFNSKKAAKRAIAEYALNKLQTKTEAR